MMQPECQYVYEIDLTGVEFEPKPNDQEVEQFQSYTVDGILTKENEKDFDEIASRIHRKLDFPMADYSKWME